jgi:hypothetical protein
MNQNILTYGAAVSSVEQVYYSPVVVVPPNYSTPLSTLYCFLAKNDLWPNDSAPPVPTQDQKYIKSVYKNIFVVKEITSNDICPVVQRFDWLSGVVYDYYRDDIDMFSKDINGYFNLTFYIKNKYDQVFKCLWNNNGQPSTIEPYFEPGTYGNNNIFQGLDNYKWKYLYTIDSGLKTKFMDTTWMPIPIGANTPNPLMTNAGCGDIEVINVTNQGSGFDPANATVSIVITGDGTGAAATPVISNGIITDIVVTNAGSNYTYCNVAVSSFYGTNATFVAPVSPTNGHGYDIPSELGCHRVMLTAQFNGSENGLIPTDITFHQLGIISNPTTTQLSPAPANGSIYSTTTNLTVASGQGSFVTDEIVFQGTSLATAYFYGTVLSFDQAGNVVKLINTVGTPQPNQSLYGTAVVSGRPTSGTVRTLLSYNLPNFVIHSGYMSYIENRSGIQRSSDGIEQFKIVLGY